MKRSNLYLFVFIMVMCLHINGPKGNGLWVGCLLAIDLLVMILMMRDFIKGDKKEQKRKQTELRRQKIAELENDLGFEPLNLHELDPLFEESRDQKEK